MTHCSVKFIFFVSSIDLRSVFSENYSKKTNKQKNPTPLPVIRE